MSECEADPDSTRKIRTFESRRNGLLGDCAIAAAFLSYAGPFPNDYRHDLSNAFEIDRCATWVKDGKFRRVALQFPDGLLRYAPDVAAALEDRTGGQRSVLNLEEMWETVVKPKRTMCSGK